MKIKWNIKKKKGAQTLHSKDIYVLKTLIKKSLGPEQLRDPRGKMFN